MGFMKEEIIFFEQLSKYQGRLYEDSVDHGVWLDEIEIEKVRKVFRSLSAVIKPEIKTWGNKEDRRGFGSTSVFKIPVEIDEGLEVGTILTVTTTKIPNFFNKFNPRKNIHAIEISFGRYSKPAK